MTYVIKFDDGTYNRGMGYHNILEDADRYEDGEAAKKIWMEIDGGCVVEAPVEDALQLTLTELAIAIKAATIEIEICVPERGYGSRAGDWSRSYISVINPDKLLAALER